MILRISFHYELIGAYWPKRGQLEGCSGRNRTSALENVLDRTLSDTITVLNSYQERQTVISSIRQYFEHILNAIAQHIQRWAEPNDPSLFADAAKPNPDA